MYDPHVVVFHTTIVKWKWKVTVYRVGHLMRSVRTKRKCGSGDSSVVRASDSWLKGRGLSPCRSGWWIFFSVVNFLCWPLFRYLFHPRVPAVTRKRTRSFCQKCRWQVTAKHACTLRTWLCMKWGDIWCMVLRCTRNAPRRQQFHLTPAMSITK